VFKGDNHRGAMALRWFVFMYREEEWRGLISHCYSLLSVYKCKTDALCLKQCYKAHSFYFCCLCIQKKHLPL